MNRSALISTLLVAVCLGLSAPRSIAKDKPIAVYVSTLDSIQPNKLVYYTGIFAAPGLDPRCFMPPDSLLTLFNEWAQTNTEKDTLNLKGLPQFKFGIMDAISVPLFEEYQTGASDPLLIKTEKPIDGLKPEFLLAPNGQKWYLPEIERKYFHYAIKRLWKLANEMNADAIIEVICAKGLTQSIELTNPILSSYNGVLDYIPAAARMYIDPVYYNRNKVSDMIRLVPDPSWHLIGLTIKIKR